MLAKVKPSIKYSCVMMIEYKAWANDVILKCLSEIDEAEVTKERMTNFKTMAHTLNHVVVIDDIFKAHVEGKKHEYTSRNTESVRCFA